MADGSWTDVRRRYLKMMADLELRLTSGNSVPVERTHLTATEFALMGEHEEACEDLSNRQAAAIAALEARVRELEADNERLLDRAESAEALASQIRTDWLPANERLAARAEQAEAALSVAQKDADNWREWKAMQKRIEDEMPKGYAVELFCSPGDWSLSLTDPNGKDIEIVDWDDTHDFIRRAIDIAIAHGGAGEGETNG